MTDHPTVEVITTVRVGTDTKTFTTTADTSGDPYRTARQLVLAVNGDAADWTHQAERNNR